jgi:hypothetical protein
LTVRARAFVLLVIAAPFAQATEYLRVANGQYNPFGQAMDMMMDAMESYGRNRAWEDTLSSYANQAQPWSWGTLPGVSPWSGLSGVTPQLPGQSQWQQLFQGMPQQRPGDPLRGYSAFTPGPGLNRGSTTRYNAGSPVNGVWQGNSGEILLVRGQSFRLYVGRDNYSDGRLALLGNRLVLANPSTGISREYEYAAHEGRLVLRDSDGNLLLYRRVPPTAVRALLP